jgi:hypothetical protein
VPSSVAIAGAGADDAAVGSVAWTSPGNITADDGVRASVALGSSLVASHWLTATNFGFAVAGVILGVTVEVERSSTSSTTDNSLKLIKGGVIGGTDHADGVTVYPAVDTIKSYGGPADLWGLALTPADVNASNFGVALQVIDVSTGSTARVDFVRMTVEYALPVGTNEVANQTRSRRPMPMFRGPDVDRRARELKLR